MAAFLTKGEMNKEKQIVNIHSEHLMMLQILLRWLLRFSIHLGKKLRIAISPQQGTD